LFPLIPDPSPLIYGKEWDKGAQNAAILEWSDSYGYRLAGAGSLSPWERARVRGGNRRVQ